MKYWQYACSLLMGFGLFAHAQSDDSFIIDVVEPAASSSYTLPDSVIDSSEAGEALRQFNGVSAGRKGGKGFEPVIRGMQQSQLNILLGGASVLGACPGRMDPPTSYVSAPGYDRVIIIKGYESVLYGSGGSGGTLIYERNTPQFGAKGYTGKLSGIYQGNSDSFSTLADISMGEEDRYLRAYGEHRNQGNYQDGNDQTVSSAFRSASGGLVLAGNITERTSIDFNVEATRDRDIHYSGNGMDAPYADANLWRLKLHYDHPIGVLDEQEFSFYYSDVNHLMDNYTVRMRKAESASGLKAPSTSKTWGTRWLGTSDFEHGEWHFGADFFSNDRNAERYKINLSDAEQSLQAAMWPGVVYRQWGIFSELDYVLSNENQLRFGIRLDRLSADATKSGNASLGSSSPDQMYQSYYGYEASKIEEQNISGVLSWKHHISSHQQLEWRASRSVRTADATERYLASRGSCCHGSDDWVGNPQIKPEEHHQLDMGYQFRQQAFYASMVVYLDEVENFILRYQSESGSYLYRNTRARIYGMEAEVGCHYEGFKPSIGMSWTRGVNKSATSTADENLPQIPALATVVRLDYETPVWGAGSRCELVTSQEKINTSSGLDAGTSPGFGICHLQGHYRLGPDVKFLGGIENLFDKAYTWHINKRSADPFSPEAMRVNEPGRTFWVGMEVEF